MSVKNRLQEFCQKNGFAIPKYVTNRIGGDDHSPIWESSIHIYDKKVFKGERSSSKRKTEENAAMKVLIYLGLERNANRPNTIDDAIIKKETKQQKIKIEMEYPTYLFFDLENVSNFRIFEDYEFNNNIKMYGFVTKFHPLANRELTFSGITKFIIDSAHRDACDTFIIFAIAQILQNETNSFFNIGIVTRDHFGAPLIEAINNPPFPLSSKPIKTAHLTTDRECIDFLQN